MAYMRGDYYIWSDELPWVHIWSAEGYDSWDTTGWACDEDEKRLENRLNASGTSLPQEVMDGYLVMRLAHMLSEGTVGEAIDRAIGPNDSGGGNYGGQMLKKNAEKIKAALSSLVMDGPDPL